MAKTEDTSNEGGPARRLALAPDELRCQKLIPADGAVSVRCSRFTVKLSSEGARDRYCISHSEAEYAEALRSKQARAQRQALEAEAERRRRLAFDLLPRVWRKYPEFQRTRFMLGRAIAEGRISPADAGELRRIIKDAEDHAKDTNWAWRLEYR